MTHLPETPSASDSSYRELFEAAPEPYLLTDVAGRIRLANERACTLFGAAREEVEGEQLGAFLAEEDRDGLRQQLDRASRGEGIHSWEVRLREGATEPRVLASVEPAPRSDNGPELRWVLWDALPLELVRDRMNRLLEESQGDAAAMRSLAEWQATLLGSAAQDMRGPLQVISSTIDSLVQDPEALTGPAARAMLERASEQVMRLRRLLPTMLQLGRLQLEGSSGSRTVVDLRELADEVLHDLAPLGHPVEFDLEVAHARVDPVQLARVLVELVNHVSEHGPTDGQIILGARRRGIDVELSLDVAEYAMADEVRQVAFSPFLGTGRGGEDGNGVHLGLSLVAVFARMHGGRAWVEELPGGGTSFRVLLSNALPDHDSEDA